MASPGQIHNLHIVGKSRSGVYLDGGNLGKLLLPAGEMPAGCATGDSIEVFIYTGPENRHCATTRKPYAVAGQFALLTAVAVTPAGAFLDWGLPKNLLAPFGEQKQKMEPGKSYVVFVYIDKKTGRVAASSKLEKYLCRQPPDYSEGQRVDLLIYDRTPIGFKAIINGTHQGVLYANDVFQKVCTGMQVRGYIRKIRDDGKIDLCLHRPGYTKVGALSKKLLAVLKQQGGFIAITDKSPPERIYRTFGVSKKTYKKAAGALYKQRLITFEKNGIKLR